MVAQHEQPSEVDGFQQRKLFSGVKTGFEGVFRADPEPYHTFGEEDGGSSILHEVPTTVENVLLFDGQTEPVAKIRTLAGEFAIPTRADLEVVVRNAGVQSPSELTGREAKLTRIGVVNPEPFGVYILPQQEQPVTAAD